MQKCLRNVSVEGRDDVQRIILGQKDEEGDDKQCRSEGEGTRQGQSSSGDHHYIGVLDTSALLLSVQLGSEHVCQRVCLPVCWKQSIALGTVGENEMFS